MKQLCENCVDSKELARKVNIKRGTIEKWLRLRHENGLSKAVIKIDRKRLIDIEQFNIWLNEHREVKI